jgi:hypothetical protein
MNDKHKGMAHEHGRGVRREKIVPVAPESQQGRLPGSGAGNRQQRWPDRAVPQSARRIAELRSIRLLAIR